MSKDPIMKLKKQVLTIILIATLSLGIANCQMKNTVFKNKKVLHGALPGTLILNLPKAPILYDGDNIDEFLALCPDGCDHNCPILYLDPDVNPPRCTTEEKQILRNLVTAQTNVREFKERIEEPFYSSPETLILYIMIVIVFIMGMILIFRRHFHFKTLFCNDFPDPTFGIPIWQFQLMKFTPSEVPDTRPQSVRIAELHRRIEKKNAEREALRQLRQRMREKKSLTDPEKQLRMVEEELEAEAAKHKQRTAAIPKKKRPQAGRRRSGALSAKFIQKDDYASLVKTRKRKMTVIQSGRIFPGDESEGKDGKTNDNTEERKTSNASASDAVSKKQKSPKANIPEPGKPSNENN